MPEVKVSAAGSLAGRGGSVLQKMARENTQVAVVGGGPVGLGLAIDLAQRGIGVVVFERGQTLHNIPKGQNLTQRTGEHFQAWGVSAAMEAAVRVPASYGTAGVTAYKTLLGPYHYRWLARSDVAAYYAARNMRLPQYDTERVLRARALELNVDLRLGHQVNGLQAGAQQCALSFTRPDGSQAEMSARYAVGCDGSRSMVREAAGITQTLGSDRRRMVLVVFRSEELHELLERFPGMSYYNALHPDHGGFWQFLGRVDLGTTWFFHCPVADDATKESFDVDACLTAAIGRKFRHEIAYLGFWDLRIAIADAYREGSVFIAGDAAHSHPPYGGYGVNAGFEDARNLSWKLAATLKGWGGEGLLESYSAERQPVFVSTARDFIERMIREDAAFLKTYDPDVDRDAFETAWRDRAKATKGDVQGFVPHYAGSPIVSGEPGSPSALGRHFHRAEAGYHLSPRGSVYDRLGSGFSLVLVGDHPALADAFAQAAGELDVPLQVLRLDRGESTARWEADCILVRPDQFIAFAGKSEPAGALSILQRAIGGG